MSVDYKALANEAAKTTNHSEEQKYTAREVPTGPAVGRFVEFIELGKRKQKPQSGKAKADAYMVRVTFEMTTDNHKYTIGEGDEAQTFYNRFSYNLKISSNARATFYKLFKKMQYGRDGITHMAQMLGEAFIFEVVKSESKEYGTQYDIKTFDDTGGEWFVSSPFKKGDPLTGDPDEDISHKVPKGSQDIKIFLWDTPNKECWDSIFIDGTKEVKKKDKDGKETGEVEQKSKNWLQEMILDATNFDGSPLQQLLGGVDGLPTEEPAKDQTKEEEPTTGKSGEQEAPAESVQTNTTAASDTTSTNASHSKTVETSEDPLDALGL